MLSDMQAITSNATLMEAENTALKEENDGLSKKIEVLETENKSLLASPDERLAGAEKEVQAWSDKLAASEKTRAEIVAKYAEMEDGLRKLESENSELLEAEVSFRDMRSRVSGLESECLSLKAEYDRVDKELGIALRECELVKAIMIHEKNAWAVEREEMVGSPEFADKIGDSPKVAEKKTDFPSRKSSMQKRPSILSTDGEIGVFADTASKAAAPTDSIIVAEMDALKSRIAEGHELVVEVQAENSRLIGLVEHERKTTVLLQAELDALPDYIFLYHQERKVSPCLFLH
jgi:hypothetical protein